MKFILILYCLLLTGFLRAQPATIININQDWLFTKEAKTEQLKWEPVHLPHTWNSVDVMDDTPGYYRGVGLYKRKLRLPKKLPGKQVYLLFEGANQFAEIFINGKKAGEHTGGYAAFSVNITDFVSFENENELLVKVDNSFIHRIPEEIGEQISLFGLNTHNLDSIYGRRNTAYFSKKLRFQVYRLRYRFV